MNPHLRAIGRLVVPGIVLTALLAAAPPIAAQQEDPQPARTRIVGAAGEPVNPDCARDNNYEVTRPEGQEMFFPNDGCMVQYNLHPYGIPPDADVRVVQMEFRITGHDGSPMCGYFGFWGRASGQSPQECRTAGDPPRIIVDVTGSSPSGDDAFLVLTWRATSMSIDNAYLASFVVESRSAVPSPPPCEPQPQCEEPCWPNCPPPQCEPQPECEEPCYPNCHCDELVEAAVCGLPGTCSVRDLPRCPPPTAIEVCEFVHGAALDLLGESPSTRSEPVSCEPPCVAGDPETCLVERPCAIGSEAECVIQRPPGCGQACTPPPPPGCDQLCQLIWNGWWAVCLAFTPAGLVGTVIFLLFPRGDSAVTCRTDALQRIGVF